MSADEHYDSETNRQIGRVLSRAVNESRIAGGVVLVARDGRLIVQQALGFADKEFAQPMCADARFRLASVTKPIVSLAAMKLVDAGKLNLHEPITRWLPHFRPRLADGQVPDISVHHLLSHSSGLSYCFQEPDGSEYHRLGVSDGLDCSGLSLEENLQRLAATTLQFEPGSAWRYSLAIDVIGAVIERVTGQPLRDAISQLIASPLGLTSLEFTVTNGTPLVTPYVNVGEQLVSMSDPADVLPPAGVNAIRFAPSRAYARDEFPSGGAGMVGTASDILKLLEIVRRNGSGFISTGMAELMVTPHVTAERRGQGDGWGFGYMGAVLTDPSVMNTPQRIGTIEWGGVYGHNWFVDRAASLTMVSLTNTTWEGVGGRVPVELRDAVYAAIGRAAVR